MLFKNLFRIFQEVTPMFCPYPTTCIYDRWRKTGVHSCAMPVCQYGMTAKAMLENEIGKLEQVRHKTERQKQKLEEIRAQLQKLNSQFWEDLRR